ncbi:hypothetical protein GZH47_04670 [Paenibacillus rhizovicinus]|uniref:Uncharacterized protein n=1 Tax=Paenibacillus rhizovicinus TaxID=2704463 RepID=A0A6C0NVI7_9BACL|nr:hypothetical protein [Paenibacillus rhizovicinus]QHW30205.1 hypothetical protein GZH47_04670 [Paenibacillus rhizovicinus]
MNDGFIALWLLSMAAILYFTGWEQAVADGMPLRLLGVFIGSSCVLQFITIAVQDQFVISGGAVLAIGTAVILLISIRMPGNMLYILFSALLTGFMWTWMRYIYSMDPVFIVIHPRWDGPVLAGLFAGLLVDRFRSHFILVVFSAVIALSSHYLGPAAHAAPLQIGSLAWWDGLAIALTAARVMGSIKSWLKEKALRLADIRSSEEGGSS